MVHYCTFLPVSRLGEGRRAGEDAAVKVAHTRPGSGFVSEELPQLSEDLPPTYGGEERLCIRSALLWSLPRGLHLHYKTRS